MSMMLLPVYQQAYQMKFQIENQWLVIAKKNRKVAASFLGCSFTSPGMVYGLTNAISIMYVIHSCSQTAV